MNQYQHLNLSDEEILKNHTITQPNFGIYSALYRESNFLDHQYIAFELFRMISSMLTNFAPLYYSHGIFHYYIKNQTLTYNTIFLKDNLLTSAQADQIWTHNLYGWSKY
jgi:hypothetical protein